MPIYGVGTDILKISRINSIMHKKYCSKFVIWTLNKNEIKIYDTILKDNNRAKYLAKRFCQKESILKAMGTGMGKYTKMQDIEIVKDAKGKPYVKIYDKTLNYIKDHISENFNFTISISDETEYVTSLAILEICNVI